MTLLRPATRLGRADTCAIAVMAKASIPGRAKTRLAPPLSLEEAATLNTAFLLDIEANLRMAAQAANIAAYMAFGPPGTAPFFEREMPVDVGLMEIWFPDFGQCLHETIAGLLDLGYGSACVLNSDSPTLPTANLVIAAQALARPGDRSVLGACTDGGYYLLGVKAAHRRLFEDVAWSTDVVARQTRERASEIGLDVVELPAWYDIDDAASLKRLKTEITNGDRDGPDLHWPSHTADALANLAAHDSSFDDRAFAIRDAGTLTPA